jgi:hypothetical protein
VRCALFAASSMSTDGIGVLTLGAICFAHHLYISNFARPVHSRPGHHQDDGTQFVRLG